MNASILGLATGVLAVSFAAILIRLCPLHPLSIAAWRLTIAAAVFGILLLWKRPTGGPWVRWAGLAGIFLGIHFATWIASLKLTSVASSVALVTTNPIFVGLGSAWWLKERVSKRLWLGIALSVLGSLAIALGDRSSSGSNPLLGDALALAGAMAGSAYLLVGRKTRAQTELIPYIAAVYGAAALTLIALAIAWRAPLWGFSQSDWLLLAGIALLPQVIGHTLINWALRFLAAGLVAVAILGEPVGASILAWIVLDEPVTPPQLCGGALILTGVVLASWEKSAASRPKDPEPRPSPPPE